MPAAPLPVDLDLRLVRYFVAVADHLNFGRAAAALYVPQPSLSRQIRSLEQELGARLFDRTTQGTQLYAGGEVFLPLARELLRAADEAAARARAVALPRQITIGYTTGIIVTFAVQDLRRRNPDADVRTLHLAWNEPRQALLDRSVDAAVARLPFPTDRLHVTVLYDEPRVLLASRDHRLAGLDEVAFSEENLLQLPGDLGAHGNCGVRFDVADRGQVDRHIAFGDFRRHHGNGAAPIATAAAAAATASAVASG